ncbi:hypothetical protein FA95DRAFT_1560367 [Auriscalpium vulgare]|uniref:Uncharacterized protein n=1 Tax=Auriscalpium vulgare TaxID=40419 RepID=A0ACB8RQA1_9AGAM|nr:hypothetical protein FA95DRAFT_1560367 [Auriscalpium vulgare]
MHAESHNAEQINFILPIARISPDTLIIIFRVLAADMKHDADRWSEEDRLYDLDWITVTHVCRYWRRVAIQDARLWADNFIVPFLFGERWIPTFLSRARQVPLTIYQLNAGRYDYDDLNPFDLEFILANLERIRGLRLYLDDDDLHALCTPAPLLEYFETAARRPFDVIYDPEGDTVLPVIPHGLFGGAAGAPALRHVRTYGDHVSTMPWTSPLLAGLVSLEISRPAEMDLISALDRMHSLERLVLHLLPAIDDQWVKVPTPRRAVALKSLRNLDLTTDAATATLLFARITLPADSTATVRCSLHSQDVVDLVRETTAFLAAATTCIFHSAAASRVHLQLPDVIRTFDRTVLVTAWRSRAAYTDTLALNVILNPYFGFWPGDDMSYMAPTVLKALVSEHLEELELCSDIPGDAWVDTLGRAQRLRRLRVERAAACTLFTALSGDLLPALSVLSIAGVDLRPGSADVAIAEGLVRYLEARAGAGVDGPEEMDVVACEVEDEFARRVREAVPGLVVRWRREDGEGAEV